MFLSKFPQHNCSPAVSVDRFCLADVCGGRAGATCEHCCGCHRGAAEDISCALDDSRQAGQPYSLLSQVDSRRTRADRPDPGSCRTQVHRQWARLWPGVAICWMAGRFTLKYRLASPAIEASLDFISPAGAEGIYTGGATATDRMAVLNWNDVCCIPRVGPRMI